MTEKDIEMKARELCVKEGHNPDKTLNLIGRGPVAWWHTKIPDANLMLRSEAIRSISA